jgi:hypothetical protein
MDPSLMKQISHIELQIIRYEESVILVLGDLGNLANILIFGQHELRNLVCLFSFECYHVVVKGMNLVLHKYTIKTNAVYLEK